MAWLEYFPLHVYVDITHNDIQPNKGYNFIMWSIPIRTRTNWQTRYGYILTGGEILLPILINEHLKSLWLGWIQIEMFQCAYEAYDEVELCIIFGQSLTKINSLTQFQFCSVTILYLVVFQFAKSSWLENKYLKSLMVYNTYLFDMVLSVVVTYVP